MMQYLVEQNKFASPRPPRGQAIDFQRKSKGSET